MKVVHLSTTDYGGAYKATLRISQSMEECGAESKVLVRTKTKQNSPVEEYFHNPITKIISKGKNFLNLLLSKGEIISDYFGTDVSKHPLVREADVVFLHWVNSFVSYKSVEKLVKLEKPIVWVMHDMWLFTGGCHCDDYCERYQQECGKCPMIKSKIIQKISQANFKRKERMLIQSNIILVGPSNWSVECAKKSSISKHNKIVYISNPIDNKIFCPVQNRDVLRKKYHVDANKKIILFGADKISQKGLKYLPQIINGLSPEKYEFFVFGNRKSEEFNLENSKVNYLGFIQDEYELAEIYSMADVFVAPSEQESFGYTVGEALACGTPVVAFGVGGILDQVMHLQTGYLTDVGDFEGLRKGISYFCDNTNFSKEDFYCNVENDYYNIGKTYKELCFKVLKGV